MNAACTVQALSLSLSPSLSCLALPRAPSKARCVSVRAPVAPPFSHSTTLPFHPLHAPYCASAGAQARLFRALKAKSAKAAASAKELDEARAQLARANAELAEERSQRQSSVAALAAAREEGEARLMALHAQAVQHGVAPAALQEEHAADLASQQQQAEAQGAALQEQHAAALATLQADYKAVLAAQRARSAADARTLRLAVAANREREACLADVARCAHERAWAVGGERRAALEQVEELTAELRVRYRRGGGQGSEGPAKIKEVEPKGGAATLPRVSRSPQSLRSPPSQTNPLVHPFHPLAPTTRRQSRPEARCVFVAFVDGLKPVRVPRPAAAQGRPSCPAML